jgi:hypothetical protein
MISTQLRLLRGARRGVFKCYDRSPEWSSNKCCPLVGKGSLRALTKLFEFACLTDPPAAGPGAQAEWPSGQRI